jgi:hypothetical protein
MSESAGRSWGSDATQPVSPVRDPSPPADQTSTAARSPACPVAVPPRPVDRSAAVGNAAGDSAAVNNAAGDSRPPVRPSAPTRAAAAGSPRASGRGRRAQLSLRRIDPRSAFVLSLLLSLFIAVVTIAAAYALYATLDALGVPASINSAVADVRGGPPVLTSSRFVGGAALLAAVNVVLFTVLATLGALLYNICASFTGGIEVTLTERD